MTLYINTTIKGQIKVALRDKKEKIKVSRSVKQQGEKLLILIDKLLKENRVSKKDITEIIVADYGGSFTSLRVGVVTANALAYALNIPIKGESGQKILDFSKFQVVKPLYQSSPSIGKSRKIKNKP